MDSDISAQHSLGYYIKMKIAQKFAMSESGNRSLNFWDRGN